MDYSWYVDECHRQLNDTKYYQKQSSDLTGKIHEGVKEHDTLPVYTKMILLTMRHLNISHPTLIPRLVVSTFSLKSTNKATLADPSYPAIATLPKAPCSDYSFTHKRYYTLFSSTREAGTSTGQRPPCHPGSNSSLYTNIPHNEGIEVCRHFLNTRQDKSLPAESISDLIRMILTMNNFSFDNEHYLQVHVTAMRTRMAPSLSVVQYTQTKSNGMDWQSVSIPLVKCISLLRMSTVANSLHW